MRTLTPLVLCSLAAAQTTWIVDDSGGPGVHFTSLPAAVAAAANGDTLLVAAGTYEAFHVANKALTILGAGATGPSATSITLPVSSGSLGPFAVYIATPPAGSTFRLAGVSISSPAGSPTINTVLTLIGGAGSGNVVLSDLVCDGSTTGALWGHAIEVHASRCQFLGGVAPPQGFPLTLGRAAGRMTGNGRLVADACWFRAASISGSAGAVGVVGGEGLVVDASRAWLFRSRLEGGDVSSSAGAGSTSGGTGLRAAASGRAWVFGTAVDRIAGGNASGFLMQNSGGAAIATDASSSVSVFGPIPLVGGSALPGTPGAVASGPNIVLGQPARPVTTMVGTAAAPDSGDLAGSQPVTLSLRGLPNQLALLFVHTIPSVLDLPGISDEPLLVDPTAFVVFAGALDANGAYSFPFTPATQAPILLDVPLHFQGCVFDAASGLWFGSNAEIRRIR